MYQLSLHYFDWKWINLLSSIKEETIEIDNDLDTIL